MDVPLLLPFSAGDRSLADLLGGKGANLAEMTRMGLLVPHGFTITTEACRAYLDRGAVPTALTAGDLADHAGFFSFGANDPTQTTWGISSDTC